MKGTKDGTFVELKNNSYVFKQEGTRIKYLPTDVKKMVAFNLLSDPIKAMHIFDKCDDEYNEIICENTQLVEFLWHKFVSKTIDVPKGVPYLGFLIEQFIWAVQDYETASANTIVNDEQRYGKNEILYENSKITLKIMEIIRKNSDMKKITKLVSKLVYLDQYNNYAINILMMASNMGNLDLVKLLIDNGSNPNFKNKLGATPLILACESNNHENIDVLKLLIDNGADINSQDHVGDTGLMHASFYYKVFYVQYLINRGANVNIKNNIGDTALSFVAKNQIPEKNKDNGAIITSYLINNGADINNENNFGQMPLILSIESGNYKILRVLVENGANIHNIKALITAVDHKNKKIVYYLLDKGINVNEKDENGNTALIVAVINNFFDMAGILIENNADVNLANMSEETPLKIAKKTQKNSIAEYLILNGAIL